MSVKAKEVTIKLTKEAGYTAYLSADESRQVLEAHGIEVDPEVDAFDFVGTVFKTRDDAFYTVLPGGKIFSHKHKVPLTFAVAPKSRRSIYEVVFDASKV